MPEEAPKNVLVSMTEKAAEAVSFDRLLITGTMGLLAMILILSAALAWNGDKDRALLVLGFYKDIAIFLSGALANSLTHRKQEGKPDA